MSGLGHQVNLISAFGRADGLAVELKRRGFSVTLYDFTKQMAQGQDLSGGPFPLVVGSTALELLNNVKEAELPRGIVFWLPQGPLELSGPMAEYFSSQNLAIQYLREGGLRRRRANDFSIEWMSQFLYQLASPWLTESTKAYSMNGTFPYDQALVLLKDATYLAVLEKNARDAGVEYIKAETMPSIELDGRRIKGSASWVWCLSSFATQNLSEDLAKKLFPEVLEPDWQWVRMDLRSSIGTWWSGVPSWSIVIEDIYLPWTHDNMFVLRKRSGGNWEAWMKVPFHRLSEPTAWHAWARGVENVLLRRLPHGQWRADESSLKTGPQGSIYDFEKRNWQAPNLSNFYFCAPEVLPRLDVACWNETMVKFIPKLEDAAGREARRAKGAQNDQTLHAP